MTLGEFRKATAHLDDHVEVKVTRDRDNILMPQYVSRIMVVHDHRVSESDTPPFIVIG